MFICLYVFSCVRNLNLRLGEIKSNSRTSAQPVRRMICLYVFICLNVFICVRNLYLRLDEIKSNSRTSAQPVRRMIFQNVNDDSNMVSKNDGIFCF